MNSNLAFWNIMGNEEIVTVIPLQYVDNIIAQLSVVGYWPSFFNGGAILFSALSSELDTGGFFEAGSHGEGLTVYQANCGVFKITHTPAQIISAKIVYDIPNLNERIADTVLVQYNGTDDIDATQNNFISRGTIKLAEGTISDTQFEMVFNSEGITYLENNSVCKFFALDLRLFNQVIPTNTEINTKAARLAFSRIEIVYV